MHAGDFVDVYKGHVLQQRSRSRRGQEVRQGRLVAVKTLKLAANERERCDLMNEASVLAQLDDPNILALVGVVTRSQPIMVVTEFMHNSSLHQFLQVHRCLFFYNNAIKPCFQSVAAVQCERLHFCLILRRM